MLSKRIIIMGERVHNVGYRPFLLWKVRELGIPNHDARNVKENGMQRVVVSVGGEENQLRKFVEFAKENYPEKAKVSDVKEVEPPEYVMLVDEYQKLLDSEQHSTMVQTGLGMLGKQDQMLGKQDQMLGKQDQMLGKQDQMIDMQKETIGLQKQTVEKLDSFHHDTVQRFDNLDERYGKIFEIMENMAKSLEKMAEKHG